MQVSDIKLGLRVRVATNDMTALIVGRPEFYRSSKTYLTRIKYENSTRYEYQINHNLSALPTEEQYPAHGGSYERTEGI